MSLVRVFLDGLQEEGVAGDPLHRHHQEETQRGGVDLRPGETKATMDRTSGLKSNSCVEQQAMTETYAELLMILTMSFQSASFCL